MGVPASSSEAEVAALWAENARPRRLLDLAAEQARPPAAAQTGLFLDRPGPVTASSSGRDKVRFSGLLREAIALRGRMNLTAYDRDAGTAAVGAGITRLVSATVSGIQPRPAQVVGVQLAAGVAVDMAPLTPALLATLKHAASMPNPAFYDRQRAHHVVAR